MYFTLFIRFTKYIMNIKTKMRYSNKLIKNHEKTSKNLKAQTKYDWNTIHVPMKISFDKYNYLSYISVRERA